MSGEPLDEWGSSDPVYRSVGLVEINGVSMENDPDWSGFTWDAQTIRGTVDPDSRDAFLAALEAGRASAFPITFTACAAEGVSIPPMPGSVVAVEDGGYLLRGEEQQPFGHGLGPEFIGHHYSVVDHIEWSYAGSDPAMVGTMSSWYDRASVVPTMRYLGFKTRTTALTCSRLYFSAVTDGLPTVTRDAAWDRGNADNGMSWYRGRLYATPHSSRNASNQWQVGTIAVPLAFNHGQFLYELSGTGTLSGRVKGVLRAVRNSGIGVSGAQVHQANMVIRIVSSDGSTVRGTLVASHEPAVADSVIWTSTMTSRKFPAGALWDGADGVPMTPVAYQDGDWIVVEYGTWTTVDGGGTGAHIHQNDQAAAAGDLPENEATTTNLRTWIDFCTPDGLP